ncbi:MAG: sulfotransferase [Gemmatimonadota bacterium]
MDKCKRFAVIVGAMKCGTTSLFRYLSEHPQVAPSSIKSPNFFADDALWERGMNWYESKYDFVPGQHRTALEASTAYTKVPYMPDCAARMAATGREFRLIYLVRDPIRRIESHYTMGQARRWDSTRVTDSAVHEKVIDLTRYASQIRRYYDRFRADKIRIIKFERLRDDPRGVLRDLCGFLEIDPHYEFPSAGTVHTASGKMTRWPDWFARFRKSPVARTLTQFVPGRRRIAQRLFGMQLVEPFRLTNPQKEQILQALEPELLELRERYGVDTADWQVPQTT